MSGVAIFLKTVTASFAVMIWNITKRFLRDESGVTTLTTRTVAIINYQLNFAPNLFIFMEDISKTRYQSQFLQ